MQQTAESVLVGRLGVPQLGAMGLGTVLFQFAVGFFAALIIATTPRVASAAAVGKRQVQWWGSKPCCLVQCLRGSHRPNACAALTSALPCPPARLPPLPFLQASQATAQGMWVALATGAVLQAVVYAKAPDVVACETACRVGQRPCVERQTAQLRCLPHHAASRALPTPIVPADMSGSDTAVASFAVLYLRARSWGLPGALVMMVAIGAARQAAAAAAAGGLLRAGWLCRGWWAQGLVALTWRRPPSPSAVHPPHQL